MDTSTLDPGLAAVRTAFDRQLRRGTEGGASVGRTYVDGRLRVVRFVAGEDAGWSAITWSDLAGLDGSQVDAAIADQVAFFGAAGKTFEWKLYDYDLPADLPVRLLAQGFVPEDPETLVVARVSELAGEVRLPAGVRLLRVTDARGLAQVAAAAAGAFGAEASGEEHLALYGALEFQLRTAPDSLAVLVALAGEEPIAQARVEFVPGSEFATLWGGGTVPAWRGRGVYRTLVAHRAALARERGYRYLTVDALPSSRPVLEGLGFRALATTTPYVWRPD
jgi:ribosomal protein S18 acetylase RimI-like enzyme